MSDDYLIQLTVNGYDDKGRSLMWNVRGKTKEEFDANLGHLAERINKLSGRRDNEPQGQTQQTNTQVPTQAPTQTQPQPTNGNGGQTFAVDTISATIADGKTTYRVKGGHFQQFGVICYPEVIQAAGFDVDPTKPPMQLGGRWIATYELNEQGKPRKVTGLRSAV